MRNALSQAFRRGGIFAGQIWLIPDHLLTFADQEPSRRTVHRGRPVLILQGDDHGDNARCQTILVAPLSSNVSNQRPWEDVLEASETPLDRPSIVKVQLVQPINRAVLESECTYAGEIAPEALERIFVHLLMNLGLV